MPPVVTGSQCTATTATTNLFTAVLPPWNPGDLAIACVASRAGTTNAPGDWETPTGQNADQLSARLSYRIMQAGDADPVFDSIASVHYVGLTAIIQAGTFDPASPLDVFPGPGLWGEGNSMVMTSNDANTITADALALGCGFNRNGNEIESTGAGWLVELEGCIGQTSTISLGGELVRKPMPVPGLTSPATWNILVGSNRVWLAAAFAVKPSGIPSGATIDVPLHTITPTVYVPDVTTVTQINVPEATYVINALVPRAGSGTLVRVPVNTANVQQYPPSLPIGDEIFVPLHVIPVTQRIPEIRTGALIPVPTFPKSGTPFVPDVGVATLVRVPLNTLSPNNRVPSVGTGARVDIPALDTLTPIEYIPTVTATPGAFVTVPLNQATVQLFVPMIDVIVLEQLPTIESDADRLSLMIDEPAKLDYAGKSYMVIQSEVDGETLDGERSMDGWIEVLMLASEAQNIPEHAIVRLNGVNRVVSKIQDREGGMALVYLT